MTVVCAVVVPRSDAVKLVVQVKLLPTPEQAPAPEATLRACNPGPSTSSDSTSPAKHARPECPLAGPADVVAGVHVRDRARSAWVLVTAPALFP